MFKVAPCSDCGGGGLRPLQYGGTRDGLEQVGGRTLSASPGGSMSPGGGSRDGETDESEPQTSDEDDASSDESFFSRYRTWLLIAAGAVLIVGLIGIKSSKK